ncbi:hypothetical protein CTI12_AA521820 [Artemisia annua]|uniref:Zinc knuckle CX2CX4HX4C n=1 Tax=Artemisia annua TaxID=35608 RepID=A0A2U1L1M9_ARTAN|nr:hypothetical protein CTI12_AA521820 [Artemisia annua]
MATSICEKPYGRASFARVLVEIDSSKKPVDSIELWYESLSKVLRVEVEYTWVPPRCDECKVFGHFTSECVRKINTVKAVDKNGDNVKAADVNKFKNSENGANNGGVDEGWQMAGNRRNGRVGGNSVRQGNFGGFNARRGMNYNVRGVYLNKANNNVSNVGVKEANNKNAPVNSGNVGKVDDTFVVNENVESANKGKAKSSNGDVAIGENRRSEKTDVKRNMAKNNPGNMNDKGSNKGNKTVKSSKGGNEIGAKDMSGSNNVATKVKDQVASACSTGVPITDNVLKGWTNDMVKWNNKHMVKGSVEQQLETERSNLLNQIVQLNRNINKNSKLNAERVMKNSVLTSQESNDVSINKPVVFWVCWFCLGTGFWKCNQVFDRGVDKLANLLCTTETRVASCAGCLIDGLGYRWLCTTGTDSNFCAGNLYWLTWSTDQDTMHYKGHVLTFVLVFFDYDDNDGLICIFGDITKFWIGAIIVVTISYALQRIGLASALACHLVVWGIARYALQNRLPEDLLWFKAAVFGWVHAAFGVTVMRVFCCIDIITTSPVFRFSVLLSMGHMGMVIFGTPLVGPFGDLHVFRVLICL